MNYYYDPFNIGCKNELAEFISEHGFPTLHALNESINLRYYITTGDKTIDIIYAKDLPRLPFRIRSQFLERIEAIEVNKSKEYVLKGWKNIGKYQRIIERGRIITNKNIYHIKRIK